jgi:hypothetical protein
MADVEGNTSTIHRPGINHARNAIDLHAQDFEVNGELHYPSCKQSHSAHTHYTLHGILDVFSVNVLVEEPVDLTSTRPIFPPVASSPPALRQTFPPPWGDHLMFCGLLKE